MDYQNNTKLSESLRVPQASIPADMMQNLQRYIDPNISPAMYSYSQKSQLALAEYFYKLEAEGRTLYHLSITYKPYSGREYGVNDVNNFFKSFYTKKFLHYLMGTKNIHTNHMKSIQPICFCFIDEHRPKVVRTPKVAIPTYADDYTINFATPLHHHAILAVHPDIVNRMRLLEGKNKLNDGSFTHKIKSSDLRECEAKTVIYASKMLKQYPDYMTFPDSFTRHRNKIKTSH